MCQLFLKRGVFVFFGEEGASWEERLRERDGARVDWQFFFFEGEGRRESVLAECPGAIAERVWLCVCE